VLLTRSPLSPGPKPWFSLDLHVLGAPPAFVLSQDQTLREDLSQSARRLVANWFPLSLSSKSPLEREETGFRASPAEAREVLDVHAVEFSKTAPRPGQPTKKASDSHGRPLVEVDTSSIRLRTKGSPLCRWLPES
jgi:hypothetical protein